MGGGSYDYISSRSRTAFYKSTVDTSGSYSTIFTKSSANAYNHKTHEVAEDVNVKNKIRESRDSKEHPDSYPIIIGLDVTGSMGSIPKYLITEALPEIMKKIIDSGIKDPQICFAAIGDTNYDDAPFQASQFESSDEKIDKSLKSIWIEGGGGSNTGESYELAWYFAARHTDIDSFNKRGKKGCLITIGDEPPLAMTEYSSYSDGEDSDKSIKQIFGGQKGISDCREILKQATEKWNVYHINMSDWSGCTNSTRRRWKKLNEEINGFQYVEHIDNNYSKQEANIRKEDIIKLIPYLVKQSYDIESVKDSDRKTSNDDLINAMLAAQLGGMMSTNKSTSTKVDESEEDSETPEAI